MTLTEEHIDSPMMSPVKSKRCECTVKDKMLSTNDLQPAAAPIPGFMPWDTSTSLANGLDLAQMPKFNPTTGQFSHLVNIQHSDAFELTPLTITEGPLKGNHALVLKPFTKYFRFLDLPPEIRNMIYRELYSYAESVRLSKDRPRDTNARAASQTRNFGDTNRSTYGRESVHFDPVLRRWAGMPPSSLNLTLACKLVREEASAILYGSNNFRFDDFTTCLLFLEGLGNSRQHLREIEFTSGAYKKSKARSVFHKLKDAKGLRAINIDSSYVYAQGWRPDRGLSAEMIANDCKTLLSTLHKSRKSDKNLPKVTDLIHLTWSACYYAHVDGRTCQTCAEREVACAIKKETLRKLIVAQLGIQE